MMSSLVMRVIRIVTVLWLQFEMERYAKIVDGKVRLFERCTFGWTITIAGYARKLKTGKYNQYDPLPNR